MGRRFLLVAVLSMVLATLPVSPALAQLSGEGPPPPEYQVKEDGTLIVGGDIESHCSQVGLDEQYLTADGSEARACEAAGFEIAGDGPPGGVPTPAASASALPETGGSGSAVVAFVPLALLVGGLLAFGIVRRNFGH